MKRGELDALLLTFPGQIQVALGLDMLRVRLGLHVLIARLAERLFVRPDPAA